MRTEKELLDMFKNAKLDSFKLNTELNETNTIVFVNRKLGQKTIQF